MRPDIHTVIQLAALQWLAPMFCLLYAAPALGLPSPKTPAEVLGIGVAFALLLGAAHVGAWRAFDQQDG